MSKNKRRHPHAWAPYNFVPMPDKPLYAELNQTDDSDENNAIPQRHDEYTAERHTGYFNVTMTTETPLFVRGMLTVTEQEAGVETRKNPNAFNIDGKLPVIPGSSLRGMIRTLVEIVTNSKMHFVSDKPLVYRAVGDTTNFGAYYRTQMTDELSDSTGHARHFDYPSDALQAGYLVKVQRTEDEDSGWAIRPAQQTQDGHSFALVDSNAVRNANIRTPFYSVSEPVWVRPQARTRYTKTINPRTRIDFEVPQTSKIQRANPNDPSYKKARIVVAGQTIGRPRHWYTAVFEPNKDSNLIKIPKDLWDIYQDDLKISRDENRETRKIGETEPLFYLMKDKSLYYFGSTMMFRLPYEKGLKRYVPNDELIDSSIIDYAEAMFGYVSEKDEMRTPSAYASRISVTSAKLTKDSPHRDNPFDETIIPKILSSPKPTTFQHYLEQPEEAKGENGDVSKLHHYGNPKAKLRGHKLYWRQMIKSIQEAAESDKSKKPDTSTQHTIMQPVSSDVEFAFKLHFDNLTDAELGALVWVLTLGGDVEARHQLGMGKPFGLGVVKLEPELVLTARQERNGRYGKLFDDDGSWFNAERPVGENEETDFIDKFKKQIPSFDDQLRINELKVLVQKQQPNASLFSYMQITPENDYQGRPVLQYPTEVTKQIEANMQAVQDQQRLASIDDIKARIQRDGLDIGDIIGGSINKSSWLNDGEFWFSPKKLHYGDGAVSLSQLNVEYEAYVSISKNNVKRREVKARIVEIDDSNQPIQLICEWLD